MCTTCSLFDCFGFLDFGDLDQSYDDMWPTPVGESPSSASSSSDVSDVINDDTGPHPSQGRRTSSTSPNPSGSQHVPNSPEDPRSESSFMSILYRRLIGKAEISSPWEKYRHVCTIARGSTAHLDVAMDEVRRRPVVVKSMLRADHVQLSAFCRELEVLRSCRHDNIVEFYGCHVMGSTMHLVMEYMDGGSLHALCKRPHARRQLTLGLQAAIVKECLQGLTYLHSRHVVHRDVRAANVLLSCSGQVKLADMGSARTPGCRDRYAAQGTFKWMAPEVIFSSMRPDPYYEATVDVWSLGVVVMEMLQGRPPRADWKTLAVYVDNMRVDPRLCDFLCKCFTASFRLRPRAEVLLEHDLLCACAPLEHLVPILAANRATV